MGDFRIVQCFGIKRRPGKPAVYCRDRYMWAAKGATAGNFGRKGAQACPNCGTPPDFRHPINRFLNGEIPQEQLEVLINEYYAEINEKN